MKCTVIGCGTAFSYAFGNGNQSFLLEENGRRMLIDCGRTTPEMLHRQGLTFRDIDDIYFSHLHNDHIGALEYAALSRYAWPKHPRNWRDAKYAIRLIGNSKLITDLWAKSLRGGLDTFEGFVADLETVFEPVRIPDNKTYEWEGWEMTLVQQIHIMAGSVISGSYGVVMKKPGHKTVYFVTDSQHCSPRQIEIYYKEADVIIQDCECSNFMSGVHANYIQLAGYPEANSVVLSPEIRAKMWLSHYQDFVTEGRDAQGNPKDWYELAAKDGFAGFVRVGQVFEF